MWDNHLVELPNDIDNIAKSLERELILRRFNKDFLQMGEATGSQLNRIIGMGVRTDRSTGKTDIVTAFYPSYIRHVINAFEAYPIAKHFGLTITDAMNLPIDQWHLIRRAAAGLAEKPDTETKLLELIRELVSLQRGIDIGSET